MHHRVTILTTAIERLDPFGQRVEMSGADMAGGTQPIALHFQHVLIDGAVRVVAV